MAEISLVQWLYLGLLALLFYGVVLTVGFGYFRSIKKRSDMNKVITGKSLSFNELTSGDRFMAFGTLWTKLDPDTARKHGKESISLGARGYGYNGDSLCSFERSQEVVFVPVDGLVA